MLQFAFKDRHRTSSPLFAVLGCCLANTALCQTAESPVSAYEIEARIDGEAWRNAHGGLAVDNRFLLHGIVTLTVNGDAAFGIPGLTLYGSTLYTNGQSINELVGSVQGISNVEAPRAWRWFETWLEWAYGAQPNSLKFGLYDVNSEFDAVDTAGLFINPSHGIGPDFSQSGANGPSIFPVASLALRSWHQRGPWTVQLAALDGTPGDPDRPTRSTVKFGSRDGLLLLAEAGLTVASGWRTAVGYWRYTAKFDDLLTTDNTGAPTQRNDNDGYYVFTDVPLFPAEHRFGLNAFVRYGNANAHINPTRSYLGGGIVLSGLTHEKSEDQLGLAFGIVRAGRDFRVAQVAEGLDTASDERIVELTYYFPATGWLSLQPDIQHVHRAGFDAAVRDAWVFGVRFSLNARWQK